MPHLQVAASEDAFIDLFTTLRDSFHPWTSGSEDAGPFSVSWNVGVRLEDGTVDLKDDGTVQLEELDVVYDPLDVTLGIDLPEICLGGFCILWVPFAGCVVRIPEVCLFSADPDIPIHIDLGGLVESEISGAFRIVPRYDVDPGRTAAMTDLDAEDAGVPNHWNLYFDLVWIDLDLIDFADTVGNLIEQAIDDAIDVFLAPLPGWMRDLFKAVLDPLFDVIRDVLDLADDIDEWLSDLLNTSIGLFDTALDFVVDWFTADRPLFGIEDPFPILGYDGSLIPVKVPIEDLTVSVNDDEMILACDIGS